MGVIGVLHTYMVSRTADPPAVSSQARHMYTRTHPERYDRGTRNHEHGLMTKGELKKIVDPKCNKMTGTGSWYYIWTSTRVIGVVHFVIPHDAELEH